MTTTRILVLGLSFFGLAAAGQTQNLRIQEPARPNNALTLIDDTVEAQGLVRGAMISTSSVTINGVRTTTVNDNGRQFKFEEDPASGITCYITERYTAEDLERLKEEQPELHMYLSSIPEKLGNSTIRVTVDIETEYHAASEDELESKHPKAFEYFQKYVKQMADNGAELHLNIGGDQPLRFRADRRENRVQELEPVKPDEDDD